MKLKDCSVVTCVIKLAKRSSLFELPLVYLHTARLKCGRQKTTFVHLSVSGETVLILYLLIPIFSLSILAKSQIVEPYTYDTTLSGGYSIQFKVDDSLQYLYLKKGTRRIVELSSTSRGLPYKNLGYSGADFKDYFILIHSFGSSNPHYIELIKKTTGKDILKIGSPMIDVDERKEILLYSENDVPSKNDKIILYNIRTGQKQFFNFPKDIFDVPEILNRIRINKLTDKQLIIKYRTEAGPKIKVYNR